MIISHKNAGVTYQELAVLVPVSFHVELQARRRCGQDNSLRSSAVVGQLILDNNSRSQWSNLADSGLAKTGTLAGIKVIHLYIPSLPVQRHILIELEQVSSLPLWDQLARLVFVIETDKVALLVELGDNKVVV